MSKGDRFGAGKIPFDYGRFLRNESRHRTYRNADVMLQRWASCALRLGNQSRIFQKASACASCWLSLHCQAVFANGLFKQPHRQFSGDDWLASS